MFSIRGVATNLMIKYLVAILLLTGLLSTDAIPILPRTPIANSYRLSDNKNTLSFHVARRELHTHETHQLRSDVGLLGERSLVKRGNCFSSQDNQNTWRCSGQTPSVAECVTQVQNHGQVGNRISVFYSGLGGAGGLATCKQYFACNPQLGNPVLWDEVVDNNWYMAQAAAIIQANPGVNTNIAVDPWQKRLAQAFAEASRGDAYVCTPESNAPNNDFNQDLAWGGWEYPALTRNSAVTSVIRVDPSTGNSNTIWRQGDAPTPNAPRG